METDRPEGVKPTVAGQGGLLAFFRKPELWRAAACLWAVFVVVTSLLPPKTVAHVLPRSLGAHMVAHSGAYIVLGLLVVWGWPRTRWLMLGVAASLLGILIEFLQPLTGHTCMVLDMAVDAAGVAVGMLTGWVLDRLGRLL